ncbi:MAG: sigma-54 dependent transcriptional regulator [Dehalococcoidia bacterium]
MTAPAGTILIVDDDEQLRQQMALFFRSTCRVETAGSREEVQQTLSENSLDPDVTLLDMHLPPCLDSIDEGLAIYREVAALRPDTVIIAMSGDADRSTGYQAVEAGMYDFFSKPIDTRELAIIVRRAMDRRRQAGEIRQLRQDQSREYHFDNILGTSAAIQRVLATVRKVADSAATVLLQGESGTGKELVARALHANSSRADGPFIAVNCSAIPETLVESELFGHEKGAFTGAVSRHAGRFERARGGTLFLDELGTLHASAQAKLLRVLEGGEFERVGGKETMQADIRLIAATNQDLEEQVAAGTFREDLYYRVRVIPLTLPPLRERREDIPQLISRFLSQAVENNRLPDRRLSPEALERLVGFRWKGNVRELRHVMESLALLADGETIGVADLPPQISGGGASEVATDMPEIPDEGFRLEEHMARHEEGILKVALKQAGAVKTRAAKLLGVNKDRMKYLCRKYDL